MSYTFEDFVAHQRRRWMRPDAHLFARQAPKGVADRDAADWRQPLLHPDHKLWNFHVPTNPQRRLAAEVAAAKGGQGFVAQLARLQVQHDSIQHAFVQLRQERRRKCALERQEAERLKRKSNAAWDKFIAALQRHWGTSRKAGFDPNQPRVPAGNADGGQWTSDGGASSSGTGGGDDAGGGINDPRILSDATPDNDWKPGAQYAQNDQLGAYDVDLREEQARGGHTIEKHVNRSREALIVQAREAFTENPSAQDSRSGSFSSLETATKLINSTLSKNQAIVDQVARGDSPAAVVSASFGSVTGIEAVIPNRRSQPSFRETYGVGVVIIHDKLSSNGFTVWTAFPSNR